MVERTILDFYRSDTQAPRPNHYTHHTPDGRRALSTEEFFRRTSALAEALADVGVRSGDRVLLLSDNRPEWHIVDLAVLDLGAVNVPVYETLSPEQLAYQAADSGAVAAVVESAAQMEKLLLMRDRCPDLAHLVQIEGGERAPGVLSFDEMISSGDTPGADSRFWDRAQAIDERDLMTIIYTSGTTGEPKGVMLSHRNLVHNVFASAPRAQVQREDLALEFLPLCHVLERMVGYIYMWRSTKRAYCSIHHVGELLARIRPHLFVGVPRFYEKVQQRIYDTVARAPASKRALFRWAVEVGREAAYARIAGRELSRIRASRFRLADRLILSEVRRGFGGRLRFCISGGAELPLHVNQFFHALGITVIEGYGLTETSPVIAVNGTAPGDLRLGTVGRPLDNLETRLADDGELLVKGPSVMTGYWNKPEETAEVIDQDGFLATGDIAEIDDDGFLLIVDRKKDLIVTAGGKNVAPLPIESHLEQSTYVDAAVLVGDRRPYVTALLSPDFGELEKWATARGVEFSDRFVLVAHPATLQLFEELVAAENASLARHEQIKKFRLIPLTLTVEGGQLTPTLKVKRRVVEHQSSRLIEQMYAE